MDTRIIDEFKILDNYGNSYEFLMHSFLTTTAAIASKRYSVMINQNFVEPLILYTVLVAPPGSNKSGAIKHILKPLYDIEEQLFDEYNEEFDRFEASKKDPLLRPQKKHVFISDITLEALHGIITKENPNILIYADEFSGFLANANRYNKGSDFQTYISLWDGLPLSVNRKHQRSIYVKEPRVSIIGTIQNEILNDIIQKNKQLTDSGFLSRFSFIAPDNIQLMPISNSHEVFDSFTFHFIKDLYRKIQQLEAPVVLQYTPEAWAVMSEYINDNLLPRVNNSLLPYVKRDILSKHRKLANRYALLFQVIQNTIDGTMTQNVGVEAVNDAIEIMNDIERYKFKLYDGVEATPLEKMTAEQKKIYYALPNEFSRDVVRKVAREIKVPETKIYHFVQDRTLFQKIKYNLYGKIFPS